ncbi:MAG: hypothetical protein ACR2OU_20710 [Thermomicrobiales bacterium]
MSSPALALPAQLVVNEPIASRPPVAADPLGLQAMLQSGFTLIDFEQQEQPPGALGRIQQQWAKKVWAGRVNELASYARNQLLVASYQQLDWRIGRHLRDLMAAEANDRLRAQLMAAAQVEIEKHRQLVDINTRASIALIREQSAVKLREMDHGARLTDRYQRTPDREARERMAAADIFWQQITQVRSNATLTEDDKDLQIEALLKAVAQFLGGHG